MHSKASGYSPNAMIYDLATGAIVSEYKGDDDDNDADDDGGLAFRSLTTITKLC